MDKAEQLKGALGALPTNEAVVLAHKLELQRALGQETLPAETILSVLRPQLQRIRPPRVPTLCRLAVAGFEDFLVDRLEDTRLPGMIPRGAIKPWWQALERMAPQEIKAHQADLARLVPKNEPVAMEKLGATVRRAAHGWTAAIIAGFQNRKLSDPATKKALGDIGLQADFAEIARILAIAEPLRQALKAVSAVAARGIHAPGHRIADLSADAVTEAKRQYLHMSELVGLESRYVALGIMNRLERPFQILRLGRALSWKPNDAMMQDTELAIVGQRLMRDLQTLANEVDAQMPSQRRGTAAVIDFEAIVSAITRYFESVQGMLAEFGFNRDSPWGTQILETRATLSRAFDSDQLERVAEIALAVLPLRRGVSARGMASDDPDLETAPTPATIEQAVRAARLLALLLQRGGRHGLSNPAKTAIDEIGTEILNRSDKLYDELAHNPGHEIAAAQITAIVRVADVLFEDGRGQVLARRLKNMQLGTAPA
jgi:hypothetical protein